eukprot:3777235-Rhodomonas_salina.4
MTLGQEHHVMEQCAARGSSDKGRGGQSGVGRKHDQNMHREESDSLWYLRSLRRYRACHRRKQTGRKFQEKEAYQLSITTDPTMFRMRFRTRTDFCCSCLILSTQRQMQRPSRTIRRTKRIVRLQRIDIFQSFRRRSGLKR